MVLEILHPETFEEFKKAFLPIVPTIPVRSLRSPMLCKVRTTREKRIQRRAGFFVTSKVSKIGHDGCLLTDPDHHAYRRESGATGIAESSGDPRERGFRAAKGMKMIWNYYRFCLGGGFKYFWNFHPINWGR